jgi:uncharacterized phiE125 gp8 family phage protein
MAVRLITPPATEPVSLADLKLHLRIDHAEEDATLTALILVARAAVERLSRRLLLTQTWRVTLDRVPDGGIVALPLAPVQTVTALRVADGAGGWTTWPGAAMVLDLTGEPARIAFRGAVPVPGQALAGIEIDVVCGYGAAAASVPPALVQAVKLLAGHWYEARGDGPGPAPIPADVTALTDGYRSRRLVA